MNSPGTCIACCIIVLVVTVAAGRGFVCLRQTADCSVQRPVNVSVDVRLINRLDASDQLEGQAGEAVDIVVGTSGGSNFTTGDSFRLRFDGTTNCLEENTLPYTTVVYDGINWQQSGQAPNKLRVNIADAGEYGLCVKSQGGNFQLPLDSSTLVTMEGMRSNPESVALKRVVTRS